MATTGPIRWGIVGLGWIAPQFAEALLELPDSLLTAVAARDPARAADFAKDWTRPDRDQAPAVAEDYLALISRDDVDVVYIATTHHNHVALAHACLDAGKPALIEKPVGLHAEEVQALFDRSRSEGIFLMEAMWTRFLPAIIDLQARLAEGVIGEPKLVQADFGISHDWPVEGRMLNPELGGGSLWDLGIYPLTFARLVFGADPTEVKSAWAPVAETGVDELSCYLASYPGGRYLQGMSGCRMQVRHEGRICGPEGRMVIDEFFHPHGYRIERYLDDEEIETEVVEKPFASTGYQYEAAEVQRCLREGLLESPRCPLDETLAIVACMDALVKEWGLEYPASRL